MGIKLIHAPNHANVYERNKQKQKLDFKWKKFRMIETTTTTEMRR